MGTWHSGEWGVQKSVMTEVDQFLKAYPEAGEDPAVS